MRLPLTLAALLCASTAMAQESTDPIKLTLHDWTGQLITTQLMGEVLKKGGYNVEYVQADYLAQFAGLETGDLHVAMEIWETTGRDAMDASTATGNVEVLGATGMQAKEEWWYPLYMKEKCPGLPTWAALKDPACAAAFRRSFKLGSSSTGCVAYPVSLGEVHVESTVRASFRRSAT